MTGDGGDVTVCWSITVVGCGGDSNTGVSSGIVRVIGRCCSSLCQCFSCCIAAHEFSRSLDARERNVHEFLITDTSAKIYSYV